MRLDWSARALADLQCAAEWSRGQAEAVVNAMEWMAETGFSLGRPIPGTGERYWPVPPLGVIYRVEGRRLLIVLRVIDTASAASPGRLRGRRKSQQMSDNGRPIERRRIGSNPLQLNSKRATSSPRISTTHS